MITIQEDRRLAKRTVMITIFQSQLIIINLSKMSTLELNLGATQLIQQYQ